MDRLKKITGDSVFVIQILILFILIFENSIEAPPLIQAFGRLHPLLLHLPIGLLIVAVALVFARRYFDSPSFTDLISFLLYFTALTASLTTLMGLVLSLENTFPDDQLFAHKWLGVALSFLCWLLLSVRNNVRILKPVSVAGLVVLIFTGHYGASLTHGDDFVLGPLETTEVRATRIITDSTALFTATIEPILESKCYSCHNDKKAKGKLILTSLESIAEGGKNGPVWKANDAHNSLIVKRISLPIENKEHMPPKDKAQVTDDELQFISLWIEAGADTQKKLNEVAETDTLKRLAQIIIPRYQQPSEQTSLYSFEFASAEKIKELSTPSRTVFQIAKNEPAVQADFYLRQTYQTEYLKDLEEVRKQLISLNLANMPVGDSDLKIIAGFDNLEVLNLNNTQVKGDGLKALASLPRLRSVSLSGTEVAVKFLHDLGKNISLKEVFIWNTAITPEELATLEKTFPRIRWDIGYIPDKNEILKLNVPFLKNSSKVLQADEKIVLKHNLPGTIVRYTLDGTDPDSLNSPVYTEAVSIERALTIKTKAFKEGWQSSDVAEFVFFKKGSTPSRLKLINKPEDRYPGEGEITLIDGQKGLSDFYRHPAWMGFYENDMIADCVFDEGTPAIRTITLSYVKNINARFFPPYEIQIWAGNDSLNLDLIAKANPGQPKAYEETRIEALNVPLPVTRYSHYRIVAKPLQRLPAFRKAKKGEKGWFMIDEIFFN